MGSKDATPAVAREEADHEQHQSDDQKPLQTFDEEPDPAEDEGENEEYGDESHFVFSDHGGLLVTYPQRKMQNLSGGPLLVG